MTQQFKFWFQSWLNLDEEGPRRDTSQPGHTGPRLSLNRIDLRVHPGATRHYVTASATVGSEKAERGPQPD